MIAANAAGKLWHVRRVNGVWAKPFQITVPASVVGPLSKPKAVQSGNKIVVSFLDKSNAPYAMVYDLEASVHRPRGWTWPKPGLSSVARSRCER